MNKFVAFVASSLIILSLFIHWVVFPYLLMLVLQWMGFHVPYLVAIGLWVLTYAILKMIQGVFSHD